MKTTLRYVEADKVLTFKNVELILAAVSVPDKYRLVPTVPPALKFNIVPTERVAA